MIILVLIVFGLCLGSFVNALVFRLYQQEELRAEAERLQKKKKSSATKLASLRNDIRNLSVARGRSKCMHCGHELAARDLIPVLSWLSLRGKCRYCGKHIPDTPAAELLVPALFVISYFAWPYALHGAGLFRFIVWLAVLVGFVALVLYDFKWFTLPDRIVFPLIGLAAVQVLILATVYHGGLHPLVTAFWGVVIASGIFYALFQVSNGKWIGGGDVKLGFVLGLLIGGPAKSFMLLFFASLLGTLVAVPLLATGKLKRTSKMPFGPFLILAAIIVMLAGSAILRWYERLLLV
jgi:prepilin signal peptidase PulO-like enzyme (type II secretory pathway)